MRRRSAKKSRFYTALGWLLLVIVISPLAGTATFWIWGQFETPSLNHNCFISYGEAIGKRHIRHGVRAGHDTLYLFKTNTVEGPDIDALEPRSMPELSRRSEFRVWSSDVVPVSVQRRLPSQPFDLFGLHHSRVEPGHNTRFTVSTQPTRIEQQFGQRVIHIPWWMVMIVAALPSFGALAIWRSLRRKRRLAKGQCPKCAYDLADLPACPECNWQRPVTQPTK